jgi:hypothetical protein
VDFQHEQQFQFHCLQSNICHLKNIKINSYCFLLFLPLFLNRSWNGEYIKISDWSEEVSMTRGAKCGGSGRIRKDLTIK